MKINPIRQKAYKVVYFDSTNKIHLSALRTIHTLPYLRVEYKTTGLVKPQIGKLFVFADEKSARTFVNIGSKPDSLYQLWEVEAYGAKKGDRYLGLSELDNSSSNRIRLWWKQKQNAQHLVFTYFSTGESVLFCSSLRMIKQIV